MSNPSQETEQPDLSQLKDEIVTTQHTVPIEGVPVPYQAQTGTVVLHETDDDGKKKAKAQMFFVAYTRSDVDDVGNRPITFAFNGGPGSSSVWLHLGLLGPRRVHMGDVDALLPPPYGLEDNDHSLLDVTDLVFIDPISTGYSRTVAGEKPDQFHNFKKDIESVGEFIRLYTTRNARWASPKYLIGESYGTTRAAGLAGHLQNKLNMYLNGLMLISSVLDFQTIVFTPNNDMPYIFFLPVYAATAWYHKRLDSELMGDLDTLLEEVEAFAQTEYALALMQGDALDPQRADALAQRIARYVGVSAEFVRRSRLRVNIHQFCKELLRNQSVTVGRLDSRFTGLDRSDVTATPDHDPSLTAIMGPYTGALNAYVRSELGFETDVNYEILTPKVQPWNYSEFQNRFVDVAETLREALSKNPHLRVMVANGRYDLATPYFATEYSFNHLGLAESLRSNVQMFYYEAGHMMYVHEPSLAQLKTDLATFVNGG